MSSKPKGVQPKKSAAAKKVSADVLAAYVDLSLIHI